MRFNGVVKSWNDERGFGFIEPSQGGQDVFVHVTAFRPRIARPAERQPVTFEIELNRDGKKRAMNVQSAVPARRSTPRQGNHAAQWGTASLFAIPAFLLLYLVVAVAWRVPGWTAVLYVLASIACFGLYAADKSAAAAGRWRVPESTLLALGLLGGWPGAIVAQQVLRHKSVKASFRAAFWASVAVNILAFVAIHSPLLGGLRI